MKFKENYIPLSLFPILFIGAVSCKGYTERNGNRIIIDENSHVNKIEILQSDSTKQIIMLRGNQITSILSYRKNILEGEKYNFHENGRLSKRCKRLPE